MTTATKPARSEIDWHEVLVEALNAPGALGDTYNRFYSYSFLNQIWLMMQGVFEPVATYKRWSELGRQVQKGHRAKSVWAPNMVNRTLTDDNDVPVRDADGKVIKRQILTGFRESRSVFGYSDTDGEELPPITVPAWDSEVALSQLGATRVKFDSIDGNIQGYSYLDADKKFQLAINPVAKYPAKTLLHELAHLLLGHCGQEPGEVIHRGVAEFEAEATAYLVSKELMLPDDQWNPAESRAYIDHWLTGHWYVNEETGDAELGDMDKHISRVFGVANKILNAGRK